MRNLPFVTFIIPTYNAEKYLEKCLSSIRKQDYPKTKYEILVVDGGSSDKTLSIAKKYKSKIINNRDRDQETGKSLGIRKGKGKIIALLDSDNEIVRRNWLKKMVFPLICDPELFGVESFYFSKKDDNIFNSYSMLIHIADPFSRCIAAKLQAVKKSGYTEYTIPGKSTYPLGANGFLWNRKVIEKVGLYKPKFEESNFSYFILERGYRKFARVSGQGIYHYHISSLWDFIAKRVKIGGKFLNRKEEKKRTWLEGVSPIKLIYAFFYCFTFIGPAIEGVINFLLTGKRAWLIHPIMSFIAVLSYQYVFLYRLLIRIKN